MKTSIESPIPEEEIYFGSLILEAWYCGFSWTGDPSGVTKKKKKKGEHVGEERSLEGNPAKIQTPVAPSSRPRSPLTHPTCEIRRQGACTGVKKTTTAFVHPIVRLLAGREQELHASTSPSSGHAPTTRRARAALGLGRTDGDDARRAADDQSRAEGRPDGRGRASTRRWRPTFPPRVDRAGRYRAPLPLSEALLALAKRGLYAFHQAVLQFSM